MALIALGEAAGGTFVNDYRIPGAQSQRAAAIGRMLDRVRTLPDVSAVGDPFRGQGADAAVSPDGRTATVTVRYGKDVRDLTAQVYHQLNAAAEPVPYRRGGGGLPRHHHRARLRT